MSMYYANKLNKLFEGDINNIEIDNTLGEAFKDNSTKILLLKQQISDINSPQKSSNSINSQLEECQLYQFKLKKISSIRAFLIQAESKNFKDLQRESKLFNITQNITTLSDNFIKTLSDDFQEITPPQGSYSAIGYDKIYSKLFKNYCDIYKTIGQEKEEIGGNNPNLRSVHLSPSDVYNNLARHVKLNKEINQKNKERSEDSPDLRPDFLSPLSMSTVYTNPLCSVMLPKLNTTASKNNVTLSELTTNHEDPLCHVTLLHSKTNKKDFPSTQPQLKSGGGVMPLIKFYERLKDIAPLQHYYNK
jgi:hypothetical protein